MAPKKAPPGFGFGKGKHKPHPGHHAPHGHAHGHHGRPRGWRWNRPWLPFWGFWPGWAPWWWADWGIWYTDVVDGCVILWIDRCSEEYAAALANGSFVIPEEWDGYPVCPVWTCGEVVEGEAFAGEFGQPAVSAKMIIGAGAAAAFGGILGFVLGGKRGALIGAVASPAGFIGASLVGG